VGCKNYCCQQAVQKFLSRANDTEWIILDAHGKWMILAQKYFEKIGN
jgi:hypothetical protein